MAASETGAGTGAGRAQLEVADTGGGVDEDTRGRCLEPFFTTKGERSTGLGLAMVYGAAQRHGVDIHIRSVPGHGTTIARRDLFTGLTDLGMPYVDGRKVARAVKQASPGTPVVLLTRWGQRLVADGDIPESVDQALSKPPKLGELRQALARHGRPVPARTAA